MNRDLDAIRREYLQGGLRRRDLPADPLDLFHRWQAQAVDAGLIDPTAMVLATVDGAGRPSQRIVLLKGVDANGFIFYTNFASRKGRELAANPQVSLLFPWHLLERQVKVRGKAEYLTPAESARYFASRPRDSQLAAWASRQSEPIPSRDTLIDRLDRIRERYVDCEVPLPEFWGGIRVKPEEIEFWQGGAMRLHDRFRYTRGAHGWQYTRLAP